MNTRLTKIKNWLIEHFFDFFMLFLAVWLGLVVDNYRDEQSDRELATDMAADLIADLGADTVNIRHMLNVCEMRAKHLDSLFAEVERPRGPAADSLLYRLSSHVPNRPFFERHSSTTAMLINSGYLSKLSKKASVALSSYDIECRKVLDVLAQEREAIHQKIFPLQQKIFHTENFQSLIEGRGFQTEPRLHAWNEDTRWTYHNYITELGIYNDLIHNYYHHLLQKGSETMNILLREYQTTP